MSSQGIFFFRNMISYEYGYINRKANKDNIRQIKVALCYSHKQGGFFEISLKAVHVNLGLVVYTEIKVIVILHDFRLAVFPWTLVNREYDLHSDKQRKLENNGGVKSLLAIDQGALSSIYYHNY